MGRVLALWFVLTAVGAVATYQWAHIAADPPIGPAMADWSLAQLRSAVAPLNPEATAVVFPAPSSIRHDGNLFFDVWYRGQRLARHESTENEFDLAVHARVHLAADHLSRHAAVRRLAQANPRALHFVITVALGDGPLLRGVPLLSTLALVPLREGLTVHLEDRLVHRTPTELHAAGDYMRGMQTPIPDLRLGVSLEAIVERIATRAGANAARTRAHPFVAHRFLAQTIREDIYPQSKRRKAMDGQELLSTATAGAAFLLRHQRTDGLLPYLYNGGTGKVLPHAPNLTRHAGTAFFLAQAARLGEMPAARDGAIRAIQWLMKRHGGTCGDAKRLCVLDGPRVRIGASALATLAGAEVLAGGDHPVISQQVRGLTVFLRAMQRTDGEFMHEFDRASATPIDVQYLYYSGEVTYALLRSYAVLGDEQDLEAAEAAMAHLSGQAWSFLGSRYYYGEEHWTCLAAGEAFKLGLKGAEAALTFCERWAEFGRAVQYGPGETLWDAEGAYGVGPVIPPLLTPVASRSEAFISLWEARSAQGRPSAALRRQIERSIDLLQRHSWTPGPTHLLADPAGAHGAMPASATSLEVRNDFVQHAMSAVLRWGVLHQAADH